MILKLDVVNYTCLNSNRTDTPHGIAVTFPVYWPHKGRRIWYDKYSRVDAWLHSCAQFNSFISIF